MTPVKFLGKQYMIKNKSALVSITLSALFFGILTVLCVADRFYFLLLYPVTRIFVRYKEPEQILFRDEENITGFYYVLACCTFTMLIGMLFILAFSLG